MAQQDSPRRLSNQMERTRTAIVTAARDLAEAVLRRQGAVRALAASTIARPATAPPPVIRTG